MQEYKIEIKEELARVVSVRAESLGEAIDAVMDMYDRQEIVLDAEDFIGKEFNEFSR